MKRLDKENTQALMEGLTLENFEERTKGLPTLLRGLLGAKVAMERVAQLEVERTTNKVEALRRYVDGGT